MTTTAHVTLLGAMRALPWPYAGGRAIGQTKRGWRIRRGQRWFGRQHQPCACLQHQDWQGRPPSLIAKQTRTAPMAPDIGELLFAICDVPNDSLTKGSQLRQALIASRR